MHMSRRDSCSRMDDSMLNNIDAAQLRREFIRNLDDKLNTFLEDVLLLQRKENGSPIRNGDVSYSNGSATRKDSVSVKRRQGGQYEKHFVIRDSVLTELLQSPHIQTIYHIFVAVLVLLILRTMVADAFDKSTLDLKFDLITWAFGKTPITITLWIVMFGSTLGLYAAFHFWASYAAVLPFENYMWLLLYCGYLIGLLVYPLRYMILHELPVASSIIIACEQVRLLMKVHAFVRENIPRTLLYKESLAAARKITLTKKDDDHDDASGNVAEVVKCLTGCPDFGKYLYFIFAPTLVYRDTYPRTPSVNWGYVVSNLAQVLGCLFYAYYIFSHFCVPVFQDFNRDHVTFRNFIQGMFACVLPGTLCLLLAFFAVLHSWLNAFAEMLRFGDRQFYKDWWNSTSFSNYYRTWNVVVHDWLYVYVYRDFHSLFGRSSRSSAMMTVFLLSAVVHEYILIVAFRFFYPVLFVEFFGFGVLMFFLTRKTENRGWNVVMWLALFVGTGLLMCLYSIEWYARKNCGPTYSNFYVDQLVPRSWYCENLKKSET